jgi:hypothetical protein
MRKDEDHDESSQILHLQSEEFLPNPRWTQSEVMTICEHLEIGNGSSMHKSTRSQEEEETRLRESSSMVVDCNLSSGIHIHPPEKSPNRIAKTTTPPTVFTANKENIIAAHPTAITMMKLKTPNLFAKGPGRIRPTNEATLRIVSYCRS